MHRSTITTAATLRTAGLVAAAVLVLPALSGCGGAGAEPEAPPPVTISDLPGQNGLKRVTLTPEAAERLAIGTVVVTAPAAGGRAAPVTLTIPYAAVVYAEDGSTWTYVRDGDQNSYHRERIEIAAIAGEVASLSTGPAVGTPVVVVGAAELLGAEAEISGEE